MTDDEKVAQRYRELVAEEPPRALDEAILAASRRTARSSRRWYAPLATAAVLVLAVALTLNMQVERPEISSPAPKVAAPAPSTVVESKTRAQEEPRSAAKPLADVATSERRKVMAQAAPAASPPPAAPAPVEPRPFAEERAAGAAAARTDQARGPEAATGGLARQKDDQGSRDTVAAARAPQASAAPALAKRAEARADPQVLKEADSPERELERIAQLRAQGRHDEADKALAEFRRRHPDFRIPVPMLERVERR